MGARFFLGRWDIWAYKVERIVVGTLPCEVTSSNVFFACAARPWPRPLSVGTCPPAVTYRANTGKTGRFPRCAEPSRKLLRWSDGRYAL
jgi:hypothetical protein